MAEWEKKGVRVKLPPVSPYGAYLLDCLWIAGPVRAGSMGDERPIDWPELVGFAQATGRVDPGHELEALFKLAQEFATGKATGRDVFSLPPYDPDGLYG